MLNIKTKSIFILLILCFLIQSTNATVLIDSNVTFRTNNTDIRFTSSQSFPTIETGNSYVIFDPGLLSIIPSDNITINLTLYNSTHIEFNESSPNVTNEVQYHIGNLTTNNNYTVKIYWNNGTKFQDFFIYSNSTGYINYNNTGYEFDRYTIINQEIPSTPYTVIIITITVIIGGVAYYLRRIKKI